jgi:hypothetical protein
VFCLTIDDMMEVVAKMEKRYLELPLKLQARIGRLFVMPATPRDWVTHSWKAS